MVSGSGPLVAATRTTELPICVMVNALTVRTGFVEPPDTSVTEVGVKEVFGPEGDTVAERFMVPLNPFMLVRVRLEVRDELCEIVIEEGLAAIENSGANLTENMRTLE